VIVGIVGAGAIGTVFGAALAGAHDVRVLTRDNRSARAIAGRGLVVDDEPPRIVSASHDPDVFAGVEIIVIAVKTGATFAALEPLRDALDGEPPFLSLQNGLEAVARIEFALRRHCAVAHAPTTEAAEATEPGRARRTGRGRTRAGWAAGHANGRALDAFVDALVSGGLTAERVQPIEPYVWAKLVANAAINPLTALADIRNGELLERPLLRARAARIALEVAAVAGASGIGLPFPDPVAYVEDVARATAANRSSMLVDLAAGRETEIDAITGAVVRAAAALHVGVPENRAVLDEVRAREKA
jgi:2-dehydropantoate 2-reductase